MKNFSLQICVDSVESAIAAEKAGAHELYLCNHLMLGGTTPSLSLLELVKSYVNIPVYVLLRPRFGDFIYSDFEFEQLKRDVIIFKQHFADGFIIGCLTREGTLNIAQLETLIALIGPMPILLGRCFDLCMDPFDTLESSIKLGICGIITSGVSSCACTGSETLKSLILTANNRIKVIASGGITATSICELIAKTHCNTFNLSCKKISFSPAVYHHPEVQLSHLPLDESQLCRTSYDEVVKIIKLLKML